MGVALIWALTAVGFYLILNQPFSDTVWWLVSIILLGIGDPITTILATRKEGIQEVNPLFRHFLGKEPGIIGLIITRFVAFGFAYAAVLLIVAESLSGTIPVGLAAYGFFAVANNLLVMLK